MNDLVISGKGNYNEEIAHYRNETTDLWALGTDEREGANLYFELHGIKINNHDNVIYKLPDEVYNYGYITPINNSICALLIYAYLLGYKNIRVVGAPMSTGSEYQEERPALAYTVGYLNGLGLNVNWRDRPGNIDYGKNSVIPM